LHLGIFEQPAENDFSGKLLVYKNDYTDFTLHQCILSLRNRSIMGEMRDLRRFSDISSFFPDGELEIKKIDDTHKSEREKHDPITGPVENEAHNDRAYSRPQVRNG
jgi:hypothetical protein